METGSIWIRSLKFIDAVLVLALFSDARDSKPRAFLYSLKMAYGKSTQNLPHLIKHLISLPNGTRIG